MQSVFVWEMNQKFHHPYFHLASWQHSLTVVAHLVAQLCQKTMLQVMPSCCASGEGVASRNWVAKCSAHESDFLPSVASLFKLASPKCCCICALNFCPHVRIPCFIEFECAHYVGNLGDVVWPQTPASLPILLFCPEGLKSADFRPMASFLDNAAIIERSL